MFEIIGVVFSSWLFRKAGEKLNKGQSSDKTRCIKILIDDYEGNEENLTLSTQLDIESTIHILEVCLKNMKDNAPQNGSNQLERKIEND